MMKSIIFIGIISFVILGVAVPFYLSISRGGDDIATSFTLYEPLSLEQLATLQKMSKQELNLDCVDNSINETECREWAKAGMFILTSFRHNRHYIRISSVPYYPLYIGGGRVPKEHSLAEELVTQLFGEEISSVTYTRRH